MAEAQEECLSRQVLERAQWQRVCKLHKSLLRPEEELIDDGIRTAGRAKIRLERPFAVICLKADISIQHSQMAIV